VFAYIFRHTIVMIPTVNSTVFDALTFERKFSSKFVICVDSIVSHAAVTPDLNTCSCSLALKMEFDLNYLRGAGDARLMNAGDFPTPDMIADDHATMKRLGSEVIPSC
jgi:hypothetical protein